MIPISVPRAATDKLRDEPRVSLSIKQEVISPLAWYLRSVVQVTTRLSEDIVAWTYVP